MPEVYDKSFEEAVLAALKKRGYMIDHRANLAFGLNVGTGVFRKADGEERRRAIGGPTPRQAKWIFKTSSSVENAADRVEALAHQKPDPGPKIAGQAASASEIDRLAEQKVRQLLQAAGLTPEVLAKIKGDNGIQAPAPKPQPKARDNSKYELTEREIEAYDLRQEKKLKYREIAEKMGVSISRANQLFTQAKKKLLAIRKDGGQA